MYFASALADIDHPTAEIGSPFRLILLHTLSTTSRLPRESHEWTQSYVRLHLTVSLVCVETTHTHHLYRDSIALNIIYLYFEIRPIYTGLSHLVLQYWLSKWQ